MRFHFRIIHFIKCHSCEMAVLLLTADIHWGYSTTLDSSQFYLYSAFHNILFQSSFTENCTLKPQWTSQRRLWQEQKSIQCLRERFLERNQTLLEKASFSDKAHITINRHDKYYRYILYVMLCALYMLCVHWINLLTIDHWQNKTFVKASSFMFQRRNNDRVFYFNITLHN